MKANKLPSYKVLHDLFIYDAESGDLYWKKSGTGRKMNKPAGSDLKMKCGKIYRRIELNKIPYLTHRIIFKMHNPNWDETDIIDHIDNLPTYQNNRIENLRVASMSQNKVNSKKYKNNTSGYNGVYWNKNAKKWESQLKKDGKKIYIGYYDTAEEAAIAYDREAIIHYGVNARLNYNQWIISKFAVHHNSDNALISA